MADTINPQLPTLNIQKTGGFQIVNLEYQLILRKLITTAKTDIDFCSYVFSFFFYRKWHPSSKIFAALTAARIRGVGIRCLLDSSRRNRPNHQANWFAYKRLSEMNIEVRMPSMPLPQHSKLFLAGPDIALIGSHNISDSSLRNPFEISILFHSANVYRDMRQWYDDVWDHYTTPWLRR
ncbi:hypothetical protein ES707_08090 [subsurface metagenome]